MRRRTLTREHGILQVPNQCAGALESENTAGNDFAGNRSNVALAARFAMIAATFVDPPRGLQACLPDCSNVETAVALTDTARVRRLLRKSSCCLYCFSAQCAAAIASGDRCRRFSSRCENGANPNRHIAQQPRCCFVASDITSRYTEEDPPACNSSGAGRTREVRLQQ